MAGAGVSGVGEHGVTAHCRGWEEGTERGEKWKNVRGWPRLSDPSLASHSFHGLGLGEG